MAETQPTGDPPAARGFAAAVAAAVSRTSPLCAGIDPSSGLLERWGLPDSADGLASFGLRCVEAFAGVVPVVKPQVAFFERWGSAGFSALETVMAAAREAGLLVIADAKRADIGSTMEAYASAWLDPASPLVADAVTVAPYLGLGPWRRPSTWRRPRAGGSSWWSAVPTRRAAPSRRQSVRSVGRGDGISGECWVAADAGVAAGGVSVEDSLLEDRRAQPRGAAGAGHRRGGGRGHAGALELRPGRAGWGDPGPGLGAQGATVGRSGPPVRRLPAAQCSGQRVALAAGRRARRRVAPARRPEVTGEELATEPSG